MARSTQPPEPPEPDDLPTEVEGRYFCDACGREVFVPLDVSAGTHQDWVEECPVCGHPMLLHADLDPRGRARLDGHHE